MLPPRRVECCGADGEQCHAHAWWYQERTKGKSVIRCPECRRKHDQARRARNHRKQAEGRKSPHQELLGPAYAESDITRRFCIGCGKHEVTGRTYCPQCKTRMDAGLPVDFEEYPTYAECRKAWAPPGNFGVAVTRAAGVR